MQHKSAAIELKPISWGHKALAKRQSKNHGPEFSGGVDRVNGLILVDMFFRCIPLKRSGFHRRRTA